MDDEARRQRVQARLQNLYPGLSEPGKRSLAQPAMAPNAPPAAKPDPEEARERWLMRKGIPIVNTGQTKKRGSHSSPS